MRLASGIPPFRCATPRRTTTAAAHGCPGRETHPVMPIRARRDEPEFVVRSCRSLFALTGTWGRSCRGSERRLDDPSERSAGCVMRGPAAMRRNCRHFAPHRCACQLAGWANCQTVGSSQSPVACACHVRRSESGVAGRRVQYEIVEFFAQKPVGFRVRYSSNLSRRSWPIAWARMRGRRLAGRSRPMRAPTRQFLEVDPWIRRQIPMLDHSVLHPTRFRRIEAGEQVVVETQFGHDPFATF